MSFVIHVLLCYTGESSTGGHIVHVGMDSESGDLLAIYDWELQCRPARRGDSRR